MVDLLEGEALKDGCQAQVEGATKNQRRVKESRLNQQDQQLCCRGSA